MAWVRTRLSAWGLLDASPQRGGFTCLTTRLSSALKSSSPKNDMYPTHWHDITKSWDLAHKTRVVISAIKSIHTHTHTHTDRYSTHISLSHCVCSISYVSPTLSSQRWAYKFPCLLMIAGYRVCDASIGMWARRMLRSSIAAQNLTSIHYTTDQFNSTNKLKTSWKIPTAVHQT